MSALGAANATELTDADRVAGLLHPLGLTRFLEEAWPGGFRHFTGDPGRLVELIDQPEFADIEALARCPVQGSLRADHTREKKPSELDITPERAVELYRGACTIYLSRIATDATRRWCGALDRAFGLIPGTTQVNAFASMPGRGLSWHWDPQEIFVVQVRGTKRWHVAPNEHVEWPTASGQAGAESRPEIRHQLTDPSRPVESPDTWDTIDLVPGSVLFVPRGYWHTTENIDESVHLVLQMKTLSWRDVFGFILQNAPDMYSLEWRKPSTAIHPDRLLDEGVAEFAACCATLAQYATPERMAALARMFGGLRS